MTAIDTTITMTTRPNSPNRVVKLLEGEQIWVCGQNRAIPTSVTLAGISLAPPYAGRMWAGLTGHQWAILLSGAVGSLLAAVIGGLVALMVVLLSNRHQSTLAAHALEMQREAFVAQLAEQRFEASRIRANQAIAHLVALAPKFRSESEESKRFALVDEMKTEAVLWEMEDFGDPIFGELMLWPDLLFATSREFYDGESEEKLAAIGGLGGLIRVFTKSLMRWPRSTEQERDQLIDDLAEARPELLFKIVAIEDETGKLMAPGGDG